MKKQEQFKALLKGCLVLLLGMFAVVTYGQKSVGDQFTTDDGITFEITSTSTTPNEVKVVGYDSAGQDTEVTIHLIVQDGNDFYTVTAVGDDTDDGSGVEQAPFRKKGLTKVTIHDNVTVIGMGAFNSNNTLTEVTIPESVTTIRRWAFAQCNIKELTLPSNLDSIGYQAFFNNRNLDLVIVKANVPPVLGENAFQSSQRKTHVIVPEGTLEAYKDPASGWTGFESITEPAKVDNTFTTDHITYKITSLDPGREAVMAIDYDPAGGTQLTIRATISHGPNTFSVTAIDNKAFWGKGLTKVTIPSTVTSIGDSTFSNNQLVSATLQGDGARLRIGTDAFSSNQLTSVTIPDGVKSIEANTFRNNQLTNVTLPSEVTSIGADAFRNNRLVDVTIPGDVTSIGANAFNDNELKTLKVQATDPPVLEDANAFTKRGDIYLILPNVDRQNYLDNGWTDFGTTIAGTFTIDAIEYGITSTTPNEVMVVGYTNATPNKGVFVPIPETVKDNGVTYTVTAIGNKAFYGANLWNASIPGSVKSIGYQAFYENQHFTTLTVLDTENPPTLHADAFQYPRRNHINVTIPLPERIDNTESGNWCCIGQVDDEIAKHVQTYKNAGWTGFRSLKTLIGQDFSVDGLRYRISGRIHGLYVVSVVKKNNANATEVIIPERVEGLQDKTYEVRYIGDDAFFKFHFDHIGGKLTKVELPNTIKQIGNRAFYGNDLTEINLPEGLTHIRKQAFYGNELTDLVIPSTVYWLQEQVFADNEISSVVLPPRLGFNNGLPNWAFWGNNLTEVTITAGVGSVGLFAFQHNPNLRLVKVEATDPPYIGVSTFVNANREQIDLVVPMSEIMIAAYLDRGWTGFRSVTFGVFTVDDIKYGITAANEVKVLEYIGTAKEVIIPKEVSHGSETYTVTAIAGGNNASQQPFRGKELTSIEIPASVTSIGQLAFGDNQLTELTLPNSVESIALQAFANNPNLDLVTVEAHDPPALDASAFANANRFQIDLVVPAGRMQVFKDHGWDGFRSISDGGTPPQPTIDAPQSVDKMEPFRVNITFDSRVMDFDVNDIQVTNADVTDFTGSGSTYIAMITPTSLCDGRITIDVSANVATSVNSLLHNMAATKVSVSVVGTCEPPIFTVNAIEDVTIKENTVYTSVAPALSGDNPKGAVTWTLGGADADNFLIDGSTGVVTMIGRDYEAPTDANADNVYEVSITANDSESSASGETSWTVTVQEDELFRTSSSSPSIPTAFTPNGDGANDRWIIDNLAEDASVRIYDRHGSVIFSSNNGYARPWDGTSRGSSLPAGSYLYVIQSGSHTYKGTITILL